MLSREDPIESFLKQLPGKAATRGDTIAVEVMYPVSKSCAYLSQTVCVTRQSDPGHSLPQGQALSADTSRQQVLVI